MSNLPLHDADLDGDEIDDILTNTNPTSVPSITEIERMPIEPMSAAPDNDTGTYVISENTPIDKENSNPIEKQEIIDATDRYEPVIGQGYNPNGGTYPVNVGQYPVIPQIKTWNRLPNESEVAFDAFTQYLAVKEENAGGLREVARRCGKSLSQMQKWSVRWSWVAGHADYENYMLLVAEGEKRKALRREAEKWAQRRSEIRDLGYELGLMLAERAKRLLALPLAKQTITRTTTASNGETIPTEITLEFQSHPRDARLFVETGLKTMRLAADLTTENFGHVPDDVDFESMEPDELDEYANKLIEMRKVAVEE